MKKLILLGVCFFFQFYMFPSQASKNDICHFNRSNMNLFEEKVNESFNGHAELNPTFFTKEQFNSAQANKLRNLGHYFFNKLKKNFPAIKLNDILFVGGLAGYGYNSNSDVDLHLLVDVTNVPDDKMLLNEYLTLLRHELHLQKLSIDGVPIQITFAIDINEKGGVYSLLKNQWIQKPQHETFNYSKEDLLKVIKERQSQLITIEKDYCNNPKTFDCQKAENHINELKRWRKQGLSEGGDTSIPNIGFRILRGTSEYNTLQSIIGECTQRALNSILNN